MDRKIPNHHIKQRICASRPAYREGRVPKAIKVYTVNNESKYVLIQGVPSVGAMEELIQLCKSFGDVEEHHPLDEYPCEDKYTEVYLIKYKKIQSARFAKRKLDDHSFFGGTLHVCYVPEYETVEETRDKLQERRKTISARIRHHMHTRGNNSSEKNTEQTTPCEKKSMISKSQSFVGEEDKKEQSSTAHVFQCSEDSGSSFHPSQTETEPSQSFSSEEIGSSNSVLPQSVTFELPLPPKPSITRKIELKHKYEYSRVPSKHSTLPIGFDGRLELINHHESQKQEDQKSHKNESTVSIESSKIIRKDYKPPRTTLKFIPRQAVKRSAAGANIDGENTTSDDIDKEIRRTAFVLGEKHGPADLPGRRNDVSETSTGMSESYRETIRTIRGKITKVITDTIELQK